MSVRTPSSEPLLTRRNSVIMCCLAVLLASVYWFTYSGNQMTSDEVMFFDAVESMARRGNARLDTALTFRTLIEFPVSEEFPAPPVHAEPMQLFAGAALFALAEAIPGVGLLHTVWLLNVLVCAMGGALFYLYARSLAYSERVAIVGTLIYGLGTIVWPYSKTFFREPLAMVLLFGAALCLNAWRQRGGHWRHSWPWLAGFIVLYLLALLTKEAALLTIPVFLALVAPNPLARFGARRLVIIVALSALLMVVGFLALNLVLQIVSLPRSYNPIARLEDISGKSEFIGYALLSYLFSPGRSLFAFSPVLLLGVVGVVILWRRRLWREAAVPILAVVSCVVGYAVLRHENWFGGLSWGPRYLVPVTLFAMLAVLPVLQAFEQPGASRWSRAGRVAAVVVIGFSVWAQLYSILPRQADYFDELNRRGVIAWEGGTWDVTQSPFLVNPGLLGRVPLDFAWLRAEGAGLWLPAGAVVMLLGAGGALWYWLRRSEVSWRGLLLTVLALTAGLSGAFYVGLRSIYRDPRYLGQFDKLHGLLALLDENAQPDDLLVLTSPDYQDFMLNYYRNRDVIAYTLRVAPGERTNPDLPPLIEDTNPDRLLEARDSIMLTNLPEYTDRVWLLNNSGPFTGFTVRPVEWFMVRHYFLLRTLQTDESARLTLFSVNSDAPPDQAMRWPEHLVDARFGQAVELVGFDIPPARVRVGPFEGPDPARSAYLPGEVVPVSLLWRARQTPDLDYSVGVFVLDAAGRVIAQLDRDGSPQGGFRPMNGWRPGETVRDNRAVQLPTDVSAGTYELWVKVYDWRTGEVLPVTGDSSTANGEAARLTTIEVACCGE